MAEKKSKLVEIKTKATSLSVEDFINNIADETKRADSFLLLKMMKKASGEDPVLWGSSIIGFGHKRYTSPATGREVDWLIIGFSPRKAALSLYLNVSHNAHADAIQNLGKHTRGVGCLYIKKLEDVDLGVLHDLIKVACSNLD